MKKGDIIIADLGNKFSHTIIMATFIKYNAIRDCVINPIKIVKSKEPKFILDAIKSCQMVVSQSQIMTHKEV